MDNKTREAIGKALLENAKLPRAHASYFNWKDKEVKELNISGHLARHIHSTGVEIANIKLGGDPPDVIFETNDGPIGVELVELVDNQAIQDQIHKRVEYLEQPKWTSDRFVEEVNRLVSIKDKPSNVNELMGVYDEYICLIHTDEPDLVSPSRENVINSHGITETNLITQVYLVVSYDPQQDKFPIYRLK